MERNRGLNMISRSFPSSAAVTEDERLARCLTPCPATPRPTNRPRRSQFNFLYTLDFWRGQTDLIENPSQGSQVQRSKATDRVSQSANESKAQSVSEEETTSQPVVTHLCLNQLEDSLREQETERSDVLVGNSNGGRDGRGSSSVSESRTRDDNDDEGPKPPPAEPSPDYLEWLYVDPVRTSERLRGESAKSPAASGTREDEGRESKASRARRSGVSSDADRRDSSSQRDVSNHVTDDVTDVTDDGTDVVTDVIPVDVTNVVVNDVTGNQEGQLTTTSRGDDDVEENHPHMPPEQDSCRLSEQDGSEIKEEEGDTYGSSDSRSGLSSLGSKGTTSVSPSDESKSAPTTDNHFAIAASDMNLIDNQQATTENCGVEEDQARRDEDIIVLPAAAVVSGGEAAAHLASEEILVTSSVCDGEQLAASSTTSSSRPRQKHVVFSMVETREVFNIEDPVLQNSPLVGAADRGPGCDSSSDMMQPRIPEGTIEEDGGAAEELEQQALSWRRSSPKRPFRERGDGLVETGGIGGEGEGEGREAASILECSKRRRTPIEAALYHILVGNSADPSTANGAARASSSTTTTMAKKKKKKGKDVVVAVDRSIPPPLKLHRKTLSAIAEANNNAATTTSDESSQHSFSDGEDERVVTTRNGRQSKRHQRPKAPHSRHGRSLSKEEDEDRDRYCRNSTKTFSQRSFSTDVPQSRGRRNTHQSASRGGETQRGDATRSPCYSIVERTKKTMNHLDSSTGSSAAEEDDDNDDDDDGLRSSRGVVASCMMAQELRVDHIVSPPSILKLEHQAAAERRFEEFLERSYGDHPHGERRNLSEDHLPRASAGSGAAKNASAAAADLGSRVVSRSSSSSRHHHHHHHAGFPGVPVEVGGEEKERGEDGRRGREAAVGAAASLEEEEEKGFSSYSIRRCSNGTREDFSAQTPRAESVYATPQRFRRRQHQDIDGFTAPHRSSPVVMFSSPPAKLKSCLRKPRASHQEGDSSRLAEATWCQDLEMEKTPPPPPSPHQTSSREKYRVEFPDDDLEAVVNGDVDAMTPPTPRRRTKKRVRDDSGKVSMSSSPTVDDVRNNATATSSSPPGADWSWGGQADEGDVLPSSPKPWSTHPQRDQQSHVVVDRDYVAPSSSLTAAGGSPNRRSRSSSSFGPPEDYYCITSPGVEDPHPHHDDKEHSNDINRPGQTPPGSCTSKSSSSRRGNSTSPGDRSGGLPSGRSQSLPTPDRRPTSQEERVKRRRAAMAELAERQQQFEEWYRSGKETFCTGRATRREGREGAAAASSPAPPAAAATTTPTTTSSSRGTRKSSSSSPALPPPPPPPTPSLPLPQSSPDVEWETRLMGRDYIEDDLRSRGVGAGGGGGGGSGGVDDYGIITCYAGDTNSITSPQTDKTRSGAGQTGGSSPFTGGVLANEEGPSRKGGDVRGGEDDYVQASWNSGLSGQSDHRQGWGERERCGSTWEAVPEYSAVRRQPSPVSLGLMGRVERIRRLFGEGGGGGGGSTGSRKQQAGRGAGVEEGEEDSTAHEDTAATRAAGEARSPDHGEQHAAARRHGRVRWGNLDPWETESRRPGESSPSSPSRQSSYSTISSSSSSRTPDSTRTEGSGRRRLWRKQGPAWVQVPCSPTAAPRKLLRPVSHSPRRPSAQQEEHLKKTQPAAGGQQRAQSLDTVVAVSKHRSAGAAPSSPLPRPKDAVRGKQQSPDSGLHTTCMGSESSGFSPGSKVSYRSTTSDEDESGRSASYLSAQSDLATSQSCSPSDYGWAGSPSTQPSSSSASSPSSFSQRRQRDVLPLHRRRAPSGSSPASPPSSCPSVSPPSLGQRDEEATYAREGRRKDDFARRGGGGVGVSGGGGSGGRVVKWTTTTHYHHHHKGDRTALGRRTSSASPHKTAVQDKRRAAGGVKPKRTSRSWTREETGDFILEGGEGAVDPRLLEEQRQGWEEREEEEDRGVFFESPPGDGLFQTQSTRVPCFWTPPYEEEEEEEEEVEEEEEEGEERGKHRGRGMLSSCPSRIHSTLSSSTRSSGSTGAYSTSGSLEGESSSFVSVTPPTTPQGVRVMRVGGRGGERKVQRSLEWERHPSPSSQSLSPLVHPPSLPPAQTPSVYTNPMEYDEGDDSPSRGFSEENGEEDEEEEENEEDDAGSLQWDHSCDTQASAYDEVEENMYDVTENSHRGRLQEDLGGAGGSRGQRSASKASPHRGERSSSNPSPSPAHDVILQEHSGSDVSDVMDMLTPSAGRGCFEEWIESGGGADSEADYVTPARRPCYLPQSDLDPESRDWGTPLTSWTPATLGTCSSPGGWDTPLSGGHVEETPANSVTQSRISMPTERFIVSPSRDNNTRASYVRTAAVEPPEPSPRPRPPRSTTFPSPASAPVNQPRPQKHLTNRGSRYFSSPASCPSYSSPWRRHATGTFPAPNKPRPRLSQRESHAHHVTSLPRTRAAVAARPRVTFRGGVSSRAGGHAHFSSSVKQPRPVLTSAPAAYCSSTTASSFYSSSSSVRRRVRQQGGVATLEEGAGLSWSSVELREKPRGKLLLPALPARLLRLGRASGDAPPSFLAALDWEELIGQAWPRPHGGVASSCCCCGGHTPLSIENMGKGAGSNEVSLTWRLATLVLAVLFVLLLLSDRLFPDWFLPYCDCATFASHLFGTGGLLNSLVGPAYDGRSYYDL